MVNDIFTLALPDQLALGDYQLITGFYEWETGQRLATETGDFLVVASGRIRK